MKTQKLEIDWTATDSPVGFDALIGTTLGRGCVRENAAEIRWLPGRSAGLSPAQPQVAKETNRCPHCDSIIYSRRSKLCGVCAQPLPDYLLFSPVQAERISNLLARERERHRRWVCRASIHDRPLA